MTPLPASKIAICVSNRRFVFNLLLVFLVVATIANGFTFWAQRVQLLDVAHWTTPGEKIPLSLYYERSGHAYLAKHVKDVFLVVLATALAVSYANRYGSHQRRPLRLSLPEWFATALALLLVTSCLESVQRFGWQFVLVQARTLLLAAICCLAAPLATRPRWIAVAMLVTTVTQLPFLAYEAYAGLPLFNSKAPFNRLAGTFNLPTVLGIWAAFTAAVCCTAPVSRRLQITSVVLAVAICLLSGSGTGMVLLLLLCGWTAHGWLPGKLKRTGATTLVLLCAAALSLLPQALARKNLFDSLIGRLNAMPSNLSAMGSTRELLLGKGLGVGSNLPEFVTEDDTLNSAVVYGETVYDALFLQFGLFGLGLFVLVLTLGFIVDRPMRVVYLLILACGFTLKISEAFPLNTLTAILVCRAVHISAKRWEGVSIA